MKTKLGVAFGAVCALSLVARPSAGAQTGVAAFDSAWKTVFATHFDTTFNGVNWRALGDSLRPHAAAARSDAELRRVIVDMLARLRQTHFMVWPREEPASGDRNAASVADLSLDVRWLPEGLFVSRIDSNSAAFAAGVRTGWRVKRIDTTSTEWIVARMQSRGDNRSLRRRIRNAAMARLAGPAHSTVRLEASDAKGAARTVHVDRGASTRLASTGNLPSMSASVSHTSLRSPRGATVAYVRVDAWMFAVAPAFDSAMRRYEAADALVLDLRGNLGGMVEMVGGTVGYFIDSTTTIGTFRTRTSTTPRIAQPRRVWLDGNARERFARPVAVLVDEATGSASEALTAALQDLGIARVFGDTTAGGVLPSAATRLPNGDVLQHAIADYVTAAGRHIEGVGVIPDRVVPLTAADARAGRDAPLAAAIGWIDDLSKPRSVAESLPDAKLILAKYIDAIGGRDALLARKTARTRGRVTLPRQGATGTVEFRAAVPRTLVVRMNIAGFGEVVSGVDSAGGWSMHPALGPRLLAGEELAALVARSTFHSELHDSTEVRTMTTTGRARFRGRDVYEVRVVPVVGSARTEMFDVESGLLVASTETHGSVIVTSLVDEYRRFGGVLSPTKLTDEVAGVGASQIMTIEELEYNTLNAADFEPPTPIKRLLEGRRNGGGESR